MAASPNPYVVLDAELNIAWLNEAYARVTMRKHEDLVGRNLFDAFPADQQSESYQALRLSFERVITKGERDEIALIHYPIQLPDGTMASKYWSATHTPLPGADGRVAHILQHTVDVTELHELRTLRDDTGLVERARAVERRGEDAREQLKRMRAMVEQAPGFVAILSGPAHRFELANAAYRELIGDREVLGMPVAEALPEVVGQGFVGLLDQVYQTGESYVGRRVEVRLRNRNGGGIDDRKLDFIYQPITGADGAIAGIYVQGHDVTDEARADEQQRVMINELNHRVKNTLAIVQGLAMQSFRTVEGGDAAYRVFTQRLEALSAAHNLLTERKWEAASLSAVLRGALAGPLGERAARCHIHGDNAELGPQTAVALAMLIHELATNATKYGALSQDEGQVDITIEIAPGSTAPEMKLTWRESGGPTITTPSGSGFGMRLIKRGIANHKDAAVQVEFPPEGLVCTIVAGLR